MSECKGGNCCYLPIGGIVSGMLSYKLYGFSWWMIVHVLFGYYYVAYWLILQSNFVEFVR